MKFDLVSDYHVEQWRSEPDWASIKPSPVLVIAGDTSNHISISADVINRIAEHYDDVIVVDGNHEFYSNGRLSVPEAMESFKRFLAEGPCGGAIHYLTSDNYMVLGDTAFVGGNGWYDFQMGVPYPREHQHQTWKTCSNDGRFIRFKDYPDKMAAEQAENIAFIVSQMQHLDQIKEIVVVTHTAPILRGLRVTGDPMWDAINGAYGNTRMGDVVRADTNHKIKVWCYGHTHYNNDFVEDHVRYISAPRGYGMENHLHWVAPQQIDTEDVRHV